MVLAVRVDIKNRQAFDSLNNKLKKFPKNMRTSAFQIAKTFKEALKKQFIQQRKRAPRAPQANKFRAVKINKDQYNVTITRAAHFLDTMKPHFAPLRRGTKITQWARKYYTGRPRKSGLSRVVRGPRGGIKGKYLFVHPDPFTAKAFNKAKIQIRRIIKEGLAKTARGG